MPLFMDRHEIPGATAEDVAEAHRRDVEIQDRYGVRYMTYWHDLDAGVAFCLVDAPSSDAANRVHREAHGLEAGEIIEVDTRVVQSFLGAINEPPTGQPWVETAFRAILFTDIEDSTALTQRLGDAQAMRIVRNHDEIVRAALAAHDGTEVKHTGDGIMASFHRCAAAIEVAIAVQREVARRNQDAETPFRLRIGVSAGEPVCENDDLYGAAVQLAARLCAQCEPGGVFVSGSVRELAAGKGFTFVPRAPAELKGFDEPVAIFAVEIQ